MSAASASSSTEEECDAEWTSVGWPFQVSDVTQPELLFQHIIEFVEHICVPSNHDEDKAKRCRCDQCDLWRTIFTEGERAVIRDSSALRLYGQQDSHKHFFDVKWDFCSEYGCAVISHPAADSNDFLAAQVAYPDGWKRAPYCDFDRSTGDDRSDVHRRYTRVAQSHSSIPLPEMERECFQSSMDVASKDLSQQHKQLKQYCPDFRDHNSPGVVAAALRRAIESEASRSVTTTNSAASAANGTTPPQMRPVHGTTDVAGHEVGTQVVMSVVCCLLDGDEALTWKLFFAYHLGTSGAFFGDTAGLRNTMICLKLVESFLVRPLFVEEQAHHFKKYLGERHEAQLAEWAEANAAEFAAARTSLPAPDSVCLDTLSTFHLVDATPSLQAPATFATVAGVVNTVKLAPHCTSLLLVPRNDDLEALYGLILKRQSLFEPADEMLEKIVLKQRIERTFFNFCRVLADSTNGDANAQANLDALVVRIAPTTLMRVLRTYDELLPKEYLDDDSESTSSNSRNATWQLLGECHSMRTLLRWCGACLVFERLRVECAANDLQPSFFATRHISFDTSQLLRDFLSFSINAHVGALDLHKYLSAHRQKKSLNMGAEFHVVCAQHMPSVQQNIQTANGRFAQAKKDLDARLNEYWNTYDELDAAANKTHEAMMKADERRDAANDEVSSAYNAVPVPTSFGASAAALTPQQQHRIATANTEKAAAVRAFSTASSEYNCARSALDSHIHSHTFRHLTQPFETSKSPEGYAFFLWAPTLAWEVAYILTLAKLLSRRVGGMFPGNQVPLTAPEFLPPRIERPTADLNYAAVHHVDHCHGAGQPPQPASVSVNFFRIVSIARKHPVGSTSSSNRSFQSSRPRSADSHGCKMIEEARHTGYIAGDSDPTSRCHAVWPCFRNDCDFVKIVSAPELNDSTRPNLGYALGENFDYVRQQQLGLLTPHPDVLVSLANIRAVTGSTEWHGFTSFVINHARRCRLAAPVVRFTLLGVAAQRCSGCLRTEDDVNNMLALFDHCASFSPPPDRVEDFAVISLFTTMMEQYRRDNITRFSPAHRNIYLKCAANILQIIERERSSTESRTVAEKRGSAVILCKCALVGAICFFNRHDDCRSDPAALALLLKLLLLQSELRPMFINAPDGKEANEAFLAEVRPLLVRVQVDFADALRDAIRQNAQLVLNEALRFAVLSDFPLNRQWRFENAKSFASFTSFEQSKPQQKDGGDNHDDVNAPSSSSSSRFEKVAFDCMTLSVLINDKPTSGLPAEIRNDPVFKSLFGEDAQFQAVFVQKNQRNQQQQQQQCVEEFYRTTDSFHSLVHSEKSRQILSGDDANLYDSNRIESSHFEFERVGGVQHSRLVVRQVDKYSDGYEEVLHLCPREMLRDKFGLRQMPAASDLWKVTTTQAQHQQQPLQQRQSNQQSHHGFSPLPVNRQMHNMSPQQIEQRSRELGKQLNKFKTEFRSNNGREATAQDFQTHRQFGPIYAEYNSLKSGGGGDRRQPERTAVVVVAHVMRPMHFAQWSHVSAIFLRDPNSPVYSPNNAACYHVPQSMSGLSPRRLRTFVDASDDNRRSLERVHARSGDASLAMRHVFEAFEWEWKYTSIRCTTRAPPAESANTSASSSAAASSADCDAVETVKVILHEFDDLTFTWKVEEQKWRCDAMLSSYHLIPMKQARHRFSSVLIPFFQCAFYLVPDRVDSPSGPVLTVLLPGCIVGSTVASSDPELPWFNDASKFTRNNKYFAYDVHPDFPLPRAGHDLARLYLARCLVFNCADDEWFDAGTVKDSRVVNRYQAALMLIRECAHNSPFDAAELGMLGHVLRATRIMLASSSAPTLLLATLALLRLREQCMMLPFSSSSSSCSAVNLQAQLSALRVKFDSCIAEVSAQYQSLLALRCLGPRDFLTETECQLLGIADVNHRATRPSASRLSISNENGASPQQESRQKTWNACKELVDTTSNLQTQFNKLEQDHDTLTNAVLTQEKPALEEKEYVDRMMKAKEKFIDGSSPSGLAQKMFTSLESSWKTFCNTALPTACPMSERLKKESFEELRQVAVRLRSESLTAVQNFFQVVACNCSLESEMELILLHQCLPSAMDFVTQLSPEFFLSRPSAAASTASSSSTVLSRLISDHLVHVLTPPQVAACEEALQQLGIIHLESCVARDRYARVTGETQLLNSANAASAGDGNAPAGSPITPSSVAAGSIDRLTTLLVREMKSPRKQLREICPAWLAFEAEQRLQIRDNQLMLFRLLERADATGTSPAVCQLNVGEGKTRVVIPMLVIHYLQRKKLLLGNVVARCDGDANAGEAIDVDAEPALPIIHILSSLRAESVNVFRRVLLSSGLGISVFEMPFTRDVNIKDRRTLAFIRTFVNIFARGKSVLLVPREFTWSWLLKELDEAEKIDEAHQQQQPRAQTAAVAASAGATSTGMKKTPITFCTYNIKQKGAASSMDEVLRHLYKKCNPDVLALQECTSLCDKDLSDFLREHSLHRQEVACISQGYRRGGSMLLVKDWLSVKRIFPRSPQPNIEEVWCEISNVNAPNLVEDQQQQQQNQAVTSRSSRSSFSLKVCGMYVHPTRVTDVEFRNAFDVSRLPTDGAYIIMGDINAQPVGAPGSISKDSDACRRGRIVDHAQVEGRARMFERLPNNKCTRHDDRTQSCIDHIFMGPQVGGTILHANSAFEGHRATSLDEDQLFQNASDHFPVLFESSVEGEFSKVSVGGASSSLSSINKRARSMILLPRQASNPMQQQTSANSAAAWARGAVLPRNVINIFDEADELFHHRLHMSYSCGRRVPLPGLEIREVVISAILQVLVRNPSLLEFARREALLTDSQPATSANDPSMKYLNECRRKGEFPSNAVQFRTVAEVSKKHDGDENATATRERFLQSRRELREKIVQAIVDDPATGSGKLAWLSSEASVVSSNQQQQRRQVDSKVLKFITDPAVSTTSSLFSSGDRKLECFTARVEELCAFRGILVLIMEHCLELRLNVRYGLRQPPPQPQQQQQQQQQKHTKQPSDSNAPGNIKNSVSNDEKCIAVPYEAADQPSQRSEFQDPDVAMFLTYLSYFDRGLTFEQFFDAVRVLAAMNKESKAKLEWERWSKSNEDRPQEFPTSFESINVGNRAQLRYLHATLRRNMHLICFWLSACVFPSEMKQFEKSIASTAWDLAALPGRSVGFSGTTDNNLLWPKQAALVDPSVSDETRDDLDAGFLSASIGRLLCRFVGATKTGKSNIDAIVHRPVELLELHQTTNNSNDNSSTADDTTAHSDTLKPWQLLLLNVMHNKNIVLIDAGALLVGSSRREMVRWLLHQEAFKKLAQTKRLLGVTYFDSTLNEMVVVHKDHPDNHDPVPLKLSTVAPENTFVIYDEARCRGADLRLRPKQVTATLTLCQHMSKDKLLQAVGRLRGLGDNRQMVRLLATEAVLTSIVQHVNFSAVQHADPAARSHSASTSSFDDDDSATAGVTADLARMNIRRRQATIKSLLVTDVLQWAFRNAVDEGEQGVTTRMTQALLSLRKGPTTVVHELQKKYDESFQSLPVATVVDRQLKHFVNDPAVSATAKSQAKDVAENCKALCEGVVTRNLRALDHECEREIEREEDHEIEVQRQRKHVRPKPDTSAIHEIFKKKKAKKIADVAAAQAARRLEVCGFKFPAHVLLATDKFIAETVDRELPTGLRSVTHVYVCEDGLVLLSTAEANTLYAEKDVGAGVSNVVWGSAILAVGVCSFDVLFLREFYARQKTSTQQVTSTRFLLLVPTQLKALALVAFFDGRSLFADRGTLASGDNSADAVSNRTQLSDHRDHCNYHIQKLIESSEKWPLLPEQLKSTICTFLDARGIAQRDFDESDLETLYELMLPAARRHAAATRLQGADRSRA